MSNLTELLSRLDKVRRGYNGSYTACCPAHSDRSPSLAIKEEDDGRILMKCMAGCETLVILRTIGIEFDDLFPTPLADHKSERRPFAAADILRLIAKEALICAATAAQLRARTLTQKEIDRAVQAAETIQRGMSAAGLDMKGIWE